MFDFRLKVFFTVAKRLNFTKASEELFISQPAVSKHIREIETYYRTKMFERSGSKIKLTPAGLILYKYTEDLKRIYQSIDHDLSSLLDNMKGTLHIGASTTVANYFLPKYLASFKQQYPEIKISFCSHNTEHIENLLLEGKIDVAIVEGQSKRSNLKYVGLVKDEIILCTRNNNPLLKDISLEVNDLKKTPFVVREYGSGSLEVIISALKRVDFDFEDLNVSMILENTESIKCYLLNSDTFAFLSIHSIFQQLKSGAFQIVDIKGLTIDRCFNYVTQQGNSHHLPKLFYKHLQSNNLKL